MVWIPASGWWRTKQTFSALDGGWAARQRRACLCSIGTLMRLPSQKRKERGRDAARSSVCSASKVPMEFRSVYS